MKLSSKKEKWNRFDKNKEGEGKERVSQISREET